MLGLNRKTYEQIGVDVPGNVGYKNPTMAWFTGFLFSISFVGLFSLIPLRKVIFASSCNSEIFHLAYVYILINNFHLSSCICLFFLFLFLFFVSCRS